MSKDHSTTPDGFKRCSSGDACIHPMGCIQPKTLEYFLSNIKRGKQYFSGKCRVCSNALARQKRQSPEHRERILELDRRKIHPNDYDEWLKGHLEKLYYEAHGFRRCSSGENCKHPDGPFLPSNHDYFGRTPQGKGIRSTCKMCDRYAQRVRKLGERLDTYLERDNLKFTGLKRCSAGNQCIHPQGPDLPATTEYFRDRPGRVNQLMPRCIPCQNKQSNEGAKRRGHPNVKRYNAKHPEKLATQRAIRRARMNKLPHTLTPEQWQRCLGYWESRCAYCSEKPFKIHIEHYIPVASSNCPGTVVTNIIPACERCNTAKRDVLPIAWLSANFPPNEVTAIMERIEAYFEWVRTGQIDWSVSTRAAIIEPVGGVAVNEKAGLAPKDTDPGIV
jgi:5-methylcytosine-specific restriction endonuclease McrA